MANEKLFFVGVKGLIQNKEGQILLLKSSLRDHGAGVKVYWDIPGGRIEEGHNATSTLKREIEEETGIKTLKKVKFITSVISNHQIPLSQSKKAGLVLMVYKVEIPAKSKIIISPEHTEYEWVNPARAAKRLSNKYPKEFTANLAN